MRSMTIVAAAALLVSCGEAASTKADIAAELAAEDAAQTGYVVDDTLPETIDAMTKDTDIDVALTLQATTQYRLIGRCAEGCTEFGLIASGPGAGGTGQDIYAQTDEAAPSPSPVIDFTTQSNGSVRLTITVFGCPQEKCLAGVRLYRAAAPSNRP